MNNSPETQPAGESAKTLFAKTARIVLATELVLIPLAVAATLGVEPHVPILTWLLAAIVFLLLCVTLMKISEPYAKMTGSLLHVALFLWGFLNPTMFIVGVIYGSLWIYCLVSASRLAKNKETK